MVFQKPMTSLNPAYTVGNQVVEAVRAHRLRREAGPWPGPSSSSLRSGSRRPSCASRSTRTSSRAACASGSMIALALANEPDLLVTWGAVEVAWVNHAAGGITDRDVEMAARTDTLA